MTEQKLLSELSEYADSGERTKFKLLRNWQEYKYFKKVKYSTEVLIKFLYKIADNQLKSYCKDIVSGSTDVYKLLAYNHVMKIYRCYTEELNTIQDMLDEYEAYLASGNWPDFVWGTDRPFDELWDHRGK